MSFAFEMVLRSSLILAIGLAALSLIRNQPAALRHWMLLATMGLAGAQPAMNRIVPACDATVRLTAINADAVFETRTDGSGQFQMGDVPAGDYLLSARAGNHRRASPQRCRPARQRVARSLRP